MDLRIRKKNEVYLKIEAEPHINYELADYFCFEVESAKYMQKQRRWKDPFVLTSNRRNLLWSLRLSFGVGRRKEVSI